MSDFTSFMCSLAIYKSSLEKCLFRFFAHLKIEFSSTAELHTFKNIFWILTYWIYDFQVFSLILCVFLLS